MQFLPISDPRSFTIPVVISTLIIALVIGLLSTKWMQSEPLITKTPPHISARLVQIKKNIPRKTVKKTATVKKVKKKPVVKVKKVLVNKKAAPPKEIKKAEKVVKKVKPKPVALPESDLFAALEEEEQQNDLRDELRAQKADKEQEAVMSYVSQIKALVEGVWRTPPSAKHDDELTLRIFLVPTGEITEVQLVASSGNTALDRSAEQAVWKVAQFPVPKDSVLFEKEFRKFKLKLQPRTARL